MTLKMVDNHEQDLQEHLEAFPLLHDELCRLMADLSPSHPLWESVCQLANWYGTLQLLTGSEPDEDVEEGPYGSA